MNLWNIELYIIKNPTMINKTQIISQNKIKTEMNGKIWKKYGKKVS